MNKGVDRVLELECEQGGTFTKIADESQYVQYSWTPSSEYISIENRLKFSPTPEQNREGKAIWLTEIVYHYDC